MIYLDTSVVLAHLLAEDRSPPADLWDGPLVSSRLLEYEAWTRLRAADLLESHGDLLREALGRIAFLEVVGPVLEAAAGHFLPGSLRTLDALHLASALFLRDQGARPRLATYDLRLAEGARRVELPLVDLP